MLVKIQDLTDEQANEFCARAQGWRLSPNLMWLAENENVPLFSKRYYTPTTNRAQAFELIERFKISLSWQVDNTYSALCFKRKEFSSLREWLPITGPTPQRAIVNAVIASVYGENMEVSNEH